MAAEFENRPAMGDVTTSTVHSSSEGGMAATHPVAHTLPVLAGPSTGAERNTATVGLIPIACWRVNDIRFEFDSSFVKPEIATELQHLAELRQKHTIGGTGGTGVTLYPPLSIFGHADPIGTDTYNKFLSGRRAAAIYGLLTRDVELWENLYSVHEGGDRWGTPSIITALRTLGFDPGPGPDDDKQTREAIRAFQVSRGLVSDGRAGPKTRASLFRLYMDALCGNDFHLDKHDDFLAGTDRGGKADYQGCSRFNPVLLFSRDEEIEFSAPENEEQRNSENAPNRRVMVLLFRPGTRITAAKWPCPRATESIAACTKRFWSDADRRRNERRPSERRLFENTKDTFACRFYQRLTDRSPCEKSGVARGDLGVHVYDEDTGQPLEDAQVWIENGAVEVSAAHTDKDGLAVFSGLAPGIYRVTAAKERCTVVSASATVIPGSAVDIAVFKNAITEEAEAASNKASPSSSAASTVSVPSSVLSGIYFENEHDAKELIKSLSKLTRDTLDLRPGKFVKPGSTSKPPATEELWVVKITARDDTTKAKDTGTHLIRDLTDKRSDCKVTLPTPNDRPLVFVRIDGGVEIGQTDFSEKADPPIVVRLQTTDFDTLFKGQIPKGRGAFWVTDTPPRLGNGKPSKTLADSDPAIAVAHDASPETVTILVAFAHELVHAWRDHYGVRSGGALAGSAVYEKSHSKRFEYSDSLEELKTVGLCDPAPSMLSAGKANDPRIPTENRIRAEQGLPIRAAYHPIEECPYRAGARVGLEVVSVTVIDSRGGGLLAGWRLDAVVEVTPKNASAPYQNGDAAPALINSSVHDGSIVPPAPATDKLFICDLVSGGQSIVISFSGQRTTLKVQPAIGIDIHDLNLASTTSYTLPTTVPAAEIPAGEPASGPQTVKSSNKDPDGGSYVVNYQMNTMAFWDPSGNRWDA